MGPQHCDVEGQVIEIPKEIRELHKMVTLAIDIFCQQDPILSHPQSSDMLPVGDPFEQ